MFVLQIEYKSFLNTYSFCKKKKKKIMIKNLFVKISFELNNLVLKVLGAVNLLHSLLNLNLSKNINELLEKNL